MLPFVLPSGLNGAETNCGIAHILGILLMNSCNTDIFFSNHYHLQSVRFDLQNYSIIIIIIIIIIITIINIIILNKIKTDL